MIEQLRRQRLPCWQIAAQVGISATVARRCGVLGLSRLSALSPKEPTVRYEHEAPGDMIHIDIKKLGRIKGIGHRITGDRTGQSNSREPAGNISTSPSMTTQDSPIRRSCQTKSGSPASPFSSTPCGSFDGMASRSIAS